MLLRVVVGLVLAGLLAPGIGRAAPRVELREVQARLELDGAGRGRVALELGLLVRGSALTRLALPGLANEPLSDLVTRGPAGEPLSAQLLREGGGVILQLAEGQALGRGPQRVQLSYALPDGALAWRVPQFPGARSEELLVVGPPALRSLSPAQAGVEVSSWLEGGRRMLRYRRTGGAPLQLALELPRMPARRSAPSGDGQTGLALGAWIGLLCLVGRQRARAQLAALGRTGRGLLVRAGLPGWVLLAPALLSGALWPLSPCAALAGWLLVCALTVELAAPPSAALALGRFEALPGRELRRLARARLRERSGLLWPDPASWLGAALLLSSPLALALFSGACLAPANPWGLGVLCGLLARSASSRLWLPRSLPEQVEVLVRAARRMRGVDCALNLVWYLAGGRHTQPRLRILPPAPCAGLLRLELLVDTRRAAAAQLLSVLVEGASPAERWMRVHWPDVAPERSQGGARLCFLRPVQDVGPAVDTLLTHFTRESQRALHDGRPQRSAA